ncbi:MAG: hypothetical protein A2040_00990 [Rhodocyclales bacterium GWA2_65_19]|jgi:hypothetical protein|nr:MAG: hypothetical protein A2040_00990 [Rhodocyclales bacterium GWA2_65_19]
MKLLSSLSLALCTALVASSAFAQDTTTAAGVDNNDLRDLDLLIVTGATLDVNTQRWADQAGAAQATGQNSDVRALDTIVVTGATLRGNTQRWSD